MIFAGILAAGLGVRMHRQDIPKQFLLLGDKPIIIHTLEQFFFNINVDKIVVAVPDSWRLYAEDLVSKYNLMDKEVAVISGGDNKTESIAAVVQYIDEVWHGADDSILIAHDAIRPFVTQKIINDNIDAAGKYGAAITVVPTNDTIITSDDGNRIKDIPPKQFMYAEQTPQSYRFGQLKTVLLQAGDDKIRQESEIGRIYMQAGKTIHLVLGEHSNIKIVNPYDLEVANALLKEREP